MIIARIMTGDLEASLTPAELTLRHRETGQEASFSSTWLLFNVFQQKPHDADGWTDGSLQYSAPSSGPSASPMTALALSADETIAVTWRDGASHRYSPQRLWQIALHPDPAAELPRRPWRHLRDMPSFEFERVIDAADPSERLRCLSAYLTFGMSSVRNVPPEERAIRHFAGLISRIQTTQFDDVMEFVVKDKPTNLAEVNGHIYLHNDIAFWRHPPATQLMHVLRQAEVGGENLFVDGLNVVEQLSPEDREILSRTPVHFVNASRDSHYRSVKPILVFDLQGAFREIHYNKDKMVFPPSLPSAFYDAHERLVALLNDPVNCDTQFRIPENTMVIMDNLRLLHGRTAFSDPRRYYLSCYICEDELKNRYRVQRERQAAHQGALR